MSNTQRQTGELLIVSSDSHEMYGIVTAVTVIRVPRWLSGRGVR